jgi:hypothetical protein
MSVNQVIIIITFVSFLCIGHSGGGLPSNLLGMGVKSISTSVEPTICAAVISAADTVFPIIYE